MNTRTNIRLKYLFSKRIGGAWGNEPDADNSTVCIRAADFDTDSMTHSKTDLTKRSFEADEIEKKQLLEGDLIIEKSGGGDNQPVGRVVRFDLNETALCSNFLELLRPNQDLVQRSYLSYLLYSLWNRRIVTASIKQTTGLQNLDISDYFDNKVELPTLIEQRNIVEYLDTEIAFIDHLIKQKQNQLEILFEKRQALITHAVARGINSKVKLKDSGIDWLGEIPKHWEVERTKWLFRERNKRSQTGEEELLTVSHITGVTPRSEKDVNMFEAETTEGYKIVHKDDLVINTLWAWMGAMGVAPVDGICSPAYHVYQPLEMILPGYIDAIVRMPIFAKEVTRYSKGVWSSRLRLYPEGFYEVYLPVPPIEEQQAILEFIQAEQTKIDEMSKVTSRSIELLKERRTSLITEAVTGQLSIK